MIRRAILASLAVAALGFAAIGHATEGFRAITAEGARRLSIEARPRLLPDVALADQNGTAFRLSDYKGRPVLVEFFYTRCPTVCTRLTAAFQTLSATIPAGGDGTPVLVGITFDPTHDTRDALRDYARAYGADGRTWRFARTADANGLKALLDAFGVVVIDDGMGGFDHNTAIHFVDAGGRLARIYDIEDTAAVLADLTAIR